ncbi:DUF4082 domain-containing protein [Microbacterium sp. CJ88]|uniref:DUF4082 domain-containing protein n=1 Tax=Microbacterium sp. CJ88 TaxID=3445672 RepID=UPI003F6577B6
MRGIAIAATVAVLAATFVAVQAPLAATAANPTASSSCGANINAIVCENSKPGTDPSVWDISGAGDASIQGFATDISVNAGQKVDFKIDTNARSYSVDIYRTGWYQGLGARHIASVTPSATLPQTQPQCISDVTTELYDCGTWGVSASWNVPADAVSGVYIALLTRADTGGSSHIIFVVRNDGNTSQVLFQTSDPTWQAYNTYGGSNFYQGAANGRGYKLSYNRPFATRNWVQGRDFYFSSEYATVRFMERNGYDMTYMAGVDTDRRGGELSNHKVFLSVGHDEYWSGAQRANIEAARDAGVNMQFLAGNEGYWRTRYEPSVDGSATDYRTLVSYKETWGNAQNRGGGKIDPSSEWTGTWRDPRFAAPAQGGGKPENALTGTMYMVNDSDLAVTVSSDEGLTRLWRNTSLTSMASGATTALAAHTIGYESNEDVDNGFRPAGLIRLSTTVGAVPQYLTDYGNTVVAGTTTHHITLYKAASGALVFSSASIQWGWGLDQTHDGNGAPADIRMQQAEVNLLADMGAQPGSLMSGLVPASKSTDTTAPTTVITSPTQGQAVAQGSTVTVTGTASDVGGRVAGVEVSTDGGTSWHAAQGTTSWTYSYIQQGDGSVPIIARAIDDSANFTAAGTTRNVTVSGPYSIFGATAPEVAAADDTASYELGVKFTSSSDGFVSGVRFYKGAGNTGLHTGSLWDANGNRLASIVFVNESASGWQQAQFVVPVQVVAGATYTVSYTAPNGRYSLTDRYWPYKATKTAPLSVVGGLGSTAPGVFGAAGAFPNTAWTADTNYFVDVLFTKSDTSPLRVASRTPQAGVSSVAVDTPITATFVRPAQASSVAMTVTPQGGSAIAGSVSYDAASRTARFTPSAPLAFGTTYAVTISATDTNGVAIESDAGWTFRTRGADLPAGQCPCSLYSESVTPAVTAAADPDAVTLGVKFTTSVAGSVTGLKFYKGAGNGGTHTGALWAADGTKLADLTFTGESTQGWQFASFSTPVALQPGVTYIASYVAPQGRYAATAAGYAASYARGPLTVPANGAVFTYAAGGFPAQTSTTDYGIDVVFATSTDTPAITARTPDAGATDVPVGTTVSATFAGAVKPGYTGRVVADGVEVQGTWTLDSGNTKVTFAPSAPLIPGAQVNVTLTGVQSQAGTAGPQFAWSFTTASGGQAPPVGFFGATTPVVADSGDSAAVELGLAFSSSVAGQVRAIRFFKAAGNTGVHTGSLWGPNGQRLATVTFSGESASGWQRATLSTPVVIAPGVQYTVSYFAPQGRYSYTAQAFAAPVTSGPLTTASPDNGRYRYGASTAVPTASFNATNYFVDVEFVADSAAPITVTAKTPATGATGVAVAPQISATVDQDPGSRTLALVVSTSAGTVAGQSNYSAADKKLTFTPAADLKLGTTYSAMVTVDGAAIDSWSFSTLDAVQTLFADAAPTTTVPDTDPIEVGTAFTVSQPGTVKSIRFYKTVPNTGLHRGTLWAPDGTVLAQVAFTNETASGWQRATLSTPVPVVPGTTYTVSYFSAGGRYSYEGAYFAQPRTNGYVTGVGVTNGRFVYGADGGFPTQSFNSTAYFVDAEIDFSGDAPPVETPAPAMLAKTPAADASNVDPATAAITATVSNASTASIVLTSGGTAVPGQSVFNATSGVVAFTPTAPLERGKTYTVQVTANGAPLGSSWSFSTLPAPAVTATSPAANATNVAPGAAVTATLTNAASAAIAVTSAGLPVPGASSYNATTGVVTFTPSAPLERGATFAVTTTANLSPVAGGSWSFSTVPKPGVVAVTPSAGAGNVDPTTAKITATLSNATSATATVSAGGVGVAGATSFNAATGVLTFTPSAALDWGKTYAVVVSADGAVPAGGSWTFTTVAKATLTARTPGVSATNVDPTTAKITATLSGAVTASIGVKNGTIDVPGTTALNTATGVATFTPTAPLDWAKTYTVTVTAHGTSVANGSWSFTTFVKATLTARTPAVNATGVDPTTAKVTATLTGAVNASIALTLGGVAVAGTSALNTTTGVVTFTPTVALDWTKTYTATVTANSAAVTGGAWSFTTKSAPSTIFGATATPANANTSIAQAVQIGTRFKSSAAGVVTAIRFYKGTQNTGTHTGYLWAANGTRLATVTFTNETASGWQTATLSTPVRLTVGAEYRVSMYSSTGRYPSTTSGLTNAVTSGPLSTIATGGAYVYGTGFPNTTSTTNFWVDVVFSPDN